MRVLCQSPRFIPALLPVALLAACAGQPVPMETPSGSGECETTPPCDKPVESLSHARAETGPLAAESLLAYRSRISRLTSADLSQEYDAIPTAPDTDGTRELRLVLLLSAPAAPFRDDRAALRLLQEWEKTQLELEVWPDTPLGQSMPLRDLTHWLSLTLREHIRLQAALDASQAKVRDESKRTDLCQDKLDAIRNMEKSLLERDKR